jgi:acyl-CoA synthetase (NDP forming)
MKNEKKKNLGLLFSPRAIAVIGATNTEGRIGRIIFENLLTSGRPLFPVHPKEKEILGVRVLPSIKELPQGIDLAVIVTGAKNSVAAAVDCARKGIPYIIVVAGGFSEIGSEGEEFENHLKEIPKKFNSRILGPNTLGIFIPRERIDTIFVEHGDKALACGGKIAFITQSGSVGTEALGLASNTGFGLRAFIGLGNKCDLDELDFLNYFAEDKDSEVIALYVENLENGRKFLKAAKEASKVKPVILLKAGQTPAGAKAVMSHTGRMAGSNEVVDGALRQFGILRVFDDEELCDAAKTLVMCPPAKGNRVAIITPGGGYGVMGSDHIETSRGVARLSMAELSHSTRERIREATLPFASCRNPVDLTASSTDKMYGAALDAVLDDNGVDIVICTGFFSPPAVSDALIDEIAHRAAKSIKPIIAFIKYGPFTELYLKRLYDVGVIGFPSIGRAVKAAGFLVERAKLVAAISE